MASLSLHDLAQYRSIKPQYHGKYASVQSKPRLSVPKLSISTPQERTTILICHGMLGEYPNFVGNEDVRGGILAPTTTAPLALPRLKQHNELHNNQLYRRRPSVRRRVCSQPTPYLPEEPDEAPSQNITHPCQTRFNRNEHEVTRAEAPLENSSKNIHKGLEDIYVPLADACQCGATRPRYDECRRVLRSCQQSRTLPTNFYLHGVMRLEGDPLTDGGFSDVYMGIYGNRMVALKQIRFLNYDADAERIDKRIRREAILWKQLQHPYILPFLGIDLETSSSNPPKPRLVSPWMKEGNIRKAAYSLKCSGRHYPVDDWLLQVAKGLKYLHDMGMIHGDLRGANILITNDFRVQLADFGMSSLLEATSASHGSHHGGAQQWLSPELLSGEVSRPTQASDMYSFGCLCVELYTLQNPFPHVKWQQHIYTEILAGKRPSRPTVATGKAMSDALWALVQQCWSQDLSQRPNASVLVESLSRIIS
ncbi:unnamed protein product [Somion occarium]|uniref:Protein kinase domain-containing protein n=1 Tax=Somion occarium TaxID=3059160 RepID=A0ABP1D5M1_9APHY